MTWKITGAPGTGEDLLYSQAGTPSLDLRFASTKSLTDYVSGKNLITFTRASTGTYVDSDGVIRNAATNLLLQSEDFSTTWATVRASISVNAISGPDGTTTADKLIEDSSTGTHFVGQQIDFVVGNAYTLSIYAKAAERSQIQLFFPAAYFGANIQQYFDLSTGELGTSINSPENPNITNVGGGWYRCSMTKTATVSGTATAATGSFRLANSGAISYTGDGTSGLYIWGAQFEVGSTATAYIPTGATINSAPRFDHNPLTGESLGLLIEEQRTNLLLRSEEFDNASWIRLGFLAFGSGSTANAATAPDGTTTADLLVESTASNAERTTYQSGITATTGTLTVYTKASGRSHVGLRFYAASDNWVRATYTLSGAGVASAVSAGSSSEYSATSASIEPLANGWYRVRLTATRASGLSFAVIDFATEANPALVAVSGNERYNGDGTSGLYLWGAQLEVGSFPTSYIATTTAAVTRNADLATITGANFSNFYSQDEGTVFAAAQSYYTGSQNCLATLFNSADSSSNRISVRMGNSLITSGGVLQAAFTPTPPSTGTAFKIGLAYRANDIAFDTDYSAFATDTSATLPIGMDTMEIGKVEGFTTLAVNGTIRRLTYFDRRLPDATLQAITT